MVTVQPTAPVSLTAQCRPHPEPVDIRNDSDLALYMGELAAAGDDCRQKHAALAKWATP
jgi:hypothetical protein